MKCLRPDEQLPPPSSRTAAAAPANCRVGSRVNNHPRQRIGACELQDREDELLQLHQDQRIGTFYFVSFFYIFERGISFP
jgi:hypothetical protein